MNEPMKGLREAITNPRTDLPTLCHSCKTFLECNVWEFVEKPCKLGCVHHWLVGTPFVEWQGPELVEVTNQVCKKCGDLKLNTVVLPREVVSDR